MRIVSSGEDAPAGSQPTTALLGVTAGGLSRPVERTYLMVFSASSARVVRLPRHGDVVIGRAPDVEVVLEDTAVSRHHAVISMADGRATLRDLGSQNGTHVDGARVSGERVLRSGALIAVCNTQLVYHGPREPGQGDRSLEPDAFFAQIAGEIERAAALDRSLAVVVLRAGGGGEFLVDALADELRGMDRTSTLGPGEVAALLPELEADEVPVVARRLVDALAGQEGSAARAGYAIFPRDGGDAEALVASARSALTRAEPGAAARAAAPFRTVELGGGRSMLVADEAMARLVALLERLAQVDLPILVLGETGAGKELAAALVHHLSPRQSGPLVSFNCAALQDSLAESELFGHDKGAFSGATAARAGLLESAAGGTVFLDEVGDLSGAIQAKLLRVLETRRLTRVGSTTERPLDVRVVAATNRDLLAEVEAGRFRRDLYYRLGAATLWLPPLRDRPREIAILARAFLAAGRRAAGREPAALSDEAERRLVTHGWPGNVRELKNCMEFLAAAVPGSHIDAGQVEAYLLRATGPATRPAPAPPSFRPIKDELREVEARRMIEALRAAGGVQTLAAALIEMPLRTFAAKVKQYGIDVRALKD
ncbi:MAG TPA: sigma 54-interacting transcriptional regulator [Kofleriaceae bacterium]|jgi:DNA-binding NtrC family response regulator/pSer/pThr/pTyr-binding forkhead associated (FHA) protein